MSEVIKAEINRALALRFRKKAMEIYGYRKGALKLALEDIISRFVYEGEANWGELQGKLKIKKTSVELQHEAWRKVD
ncbi:MAG: hypothetical protein DRN04_02160 [Thermoprotei archaeon]|nr:MAG: hypothetical protein DRN04_02160 [Thermoprotei archaeon]